MSSSRYEEKIPCRVRESETETLTLNCITVSGGCWDVTLHSCVEEHWQMPEQRPSGWRYACGFLNPHRTVGYTAEVGSPVREAVVAAYQEAKVR